MLHRAISLLLVLSFTYSSAESALGAVRDGATHHESNAEAVAHQIEAGSKHDHQDRDPVGSEHRHGGAADHCTHQHSVPLTTVSAPMRGVCETSMPIFTESTFHRARSTEVPLRPPRA